MSAMNCLTSSSVNWCLIIVDFMGILSCFHALSNAARLSMSAFLSW